MAFCPTEIPALDATNLFIEGTADAADNRLVDIYLWINTKNGKKYVGQTVRALQATLPDGSIKWRPHGTAGRARLHVWCALTERDDCPALYRAIRKHGLSSFTVQTVATVPKDEADAAEIQFIQDHGSLRPTGYNIAAGGLAGVHTVAKGPQSLETKIKRSLAIRANNPLYEEETDLPMYITRTPNGYAVNKEGLPTRKFASSKDSMPDKLKLAKDFLASVIAKQPIEQQYDIELPMYVSRRTHATGTKGLRITVKVDKKVIFSRDIFVGTFASQLDTAVQCLQQLIDSKQLDPSKKGVFGKKSLAEYFEQRAAENVDLSKDKDRPLENQRQVQRKKRTPKDASLPTYIRKHTSGKSFGYGVILPGHPSKNFTSGKLTMEQKLEKAKEHLAALKAYELKSDTATGS